MWCRTAWPKTRSKLSSSKGSCSASAATVSTLEAELAPRSASASSSIPGEMSVAVGALDHARLQQVEREVAGAGADLERVAERLARASSPSALTSF